MSKDSPTIKRLVELFSQIVTRCRVGNHARFNYAPAVHSDCFGAMLEQLEPRIMLSAAPVVENAIGDAQLTAGQQITVDLFDTFDDDETVFRFDSNMGNVDVLMYEDDCPATVENFRRYSRAGAYDNTIIHRSMANFVLQGGGFNYEYVGNFWNIEQLADLFDPVVNEYQHSNVAGTMAMAKLGGNPDSATSQWFFNLRDNSANLDNQNGGFTVFGEVLDAGMANVINPMAAVRVYNAGAPLDTLPLRNYDNSLTQLTDNNYLVFYDIYETSMTYSVTGNTNPNLATPHIDPATGQLSVTAAQGVSGQSDITITATDREGKTVSDTFTIVVGASSPFCLDIDNNGQEQPLGDGILVIRHMAGFTAQALIAGVVDPSGSRTDPGAVEGYLDQGQSYLDIDDDGQSSPLGDGILIIRYLAGFTGQALIEGVVNPNGGRTSAEEIMVYLDSLRCSTNSSPLTAVALVQEAPASGSGSSALPAEPSQWPVLSGLVNAETTPADIQGQVIYLAFDGAQDVVYDGPVTVGPFDVPRLGLPAAFSGQKDSITTQILQALKRTFAGSGVIFTLQRPLDGELYSTVYFTADDGLFSEYGSFLGLAEQVDVGNRLKTDEALVFISNILKSDSDLKSYLQSLLQVAVHEIGHLLGYRHS